MILQFFSPQINWNPNRAPKDSVGVQANQNSWECRETEARKIKTPGEKDECGWGRKRRGMMELTGRMWQTHRWVRTNPTPMCEHILSFAAEKNVFFCKEHTKHKRVWAESDLDWSRFHEWRVNAILSCSRHLLAQSECEDDRESVSLALSKYTKKPRSHFHRSSMVAWKLKKKSSTLTLWTLYQNLKC